MDSGRLGPYAGRAAWNKPQASPELPGGALDAWQRAPLESRGWKPAQAEDLPRPWNRPRRIREALTSNHSGGGCHKFHSGGVVWSWTH